MGITRNIQPQLNGIDKIEAANPSVHKLSNGIPVHIIEAGDQDITRVDIIFQAGSRYQDKIFQASFTNSQLIEGSKDRTSKQIANELDYYGSYVIPSCDRDEAHIQVYSLGKFLTPTFDVVEDIIKRPTFPESELNILKKKRLQSLSIENLKVEHRARKTFFQQIFGLNHPYGQTGEPEDVNQISQEMMVDYHRSFYHPGNTSIIISGMGAESHLKELEDYFGSWSKKNSNNNGLQSIPPENPAVDTEFRIEIPGSVQSAIRIGKITPIKSHEDFSALSIINTILGGYFGSRLMQNIREDKGYTYGIGSTLHSFKEKGVFVISTDVGVDHYEDTIKECYREVERLTEKPVSDQELKRVIQYVEGELLRQLDGPFNLAESFKSLLTFGLNFDYLETYLNVLYNITPLEILNISRKYFSSDSLINVVAGLSPK